MSNVLTELVSALASGSVRVVDLTQTLRPSTPVIQLPPEFGQTPPFRIEEISHYDERGPGWYWNTFSCGEHTGTHFEAAGGERVGGAVGHVLAGDPVRRRIEVGPGVLTASERVPVPARAALVVARDLVDRERRGLTELGRQLDHRGRRLQGLGEVDDLDRTLPQGRDQLGQHRAHQSAPSACLILAAGRIDVAPGSRREPRQGRGRADRPAHQLARTVGADPGQLLGGTGGAKGALERADPRVRRFRRQIAVTAFTVRLELQHGLVPQPAPAR